MQSSYPEAFLREMSCTQEEWLRWLPDAIGVHPWERDGHRAVIAIGEGSLVLEWSVQDARRIALVKLPTLRVAFRFERLDASARKVFMKRFDLYMQRGGG